MGLTQGLIRRSTVLVLFAFFLIILDAYAQIDTSFEQTLNFFSDTRIRVEQDWNVRKANNELKDQRTRMRFRFRFGFDYLWSEEISFGARMRSGVPEDQQSPHWTLGKEFEVYSFKIDRVYIKGAHKHFWWWVGKNNYPFWKQNELFWDDDVMPEGVALGTDFSIQENMLLKWVGGIFISKSAGSFFDNDGIFYASQFTLSHETSKSGLKFSSGLFHFKNLLDLNQKPEDRTLNYSLWMSGLQYALKWKKRIKVGIDFSYNFEDYADKDWIAGADLEDENLGFVVSVSIGSLKKKGDFDFGYRYARIKKYAVVDYFAQDDWVSWSFPDGTAGTRSSNFKGHEFQAGYAFGPKFNVVTRMYLVNGIKRNDPADLSIESANRFRVDLNIGF